MSPSRLRIGEAARHTGLSTASIRYYEREGLLPGTSRGDNRYRAYDTADLHRLRFIRLCRALDMSLDEVRTLLGLDLNDRDHCRAARQTLDAHLSHVRERLAELRTLERDLKALRDRCDGSDDFCHIIETLHKEADRPSVAPVRGTGPRHV
ncbi:MAG: MerR family transcriptional regulator [Burkholderiaceae bacterium]